MSDQRILSADELIGILMCMSPAYSAIQLCAHIDALAAELSRVTKERDEAAEQALSRVLAAEYREGEWQNRYARAEAELAALKAERAEDTARLDWLEAELEREKIDGHWVHSLFRRNVPITRKAIDAARAAGKECQ